MTELLQAKRPVVSVACGITWHGCILAAIQRNKNPEVHNKFCIPGGKTEFETIEETFWRELEEETNLKKIKGASPEIIGYYQDLSEKHRFVIMMHLQYRIEMGIPVRREPRKTKKWQWVMPYLVPDEMRTKRLKFFLKNLERAKL